IKPAAFSPCRPVLSDEIIDVYSSVDDWDSAKSVLKRRMAGEYLFVESRIEACGHSGIFAYYFKGLDYNNQNTTYIVCDDETISRIEIVCREHSPIAKLFISIITVFN
ncbi:MAG: hypothetical protein U9P44_03020, partial [archaeon]|nr:hypothetical protein [archaeon]